MESMKRMNYAHRGFSGKYPENTMLAFRKAFEAGCDGIELDVQLTKDHELVIIHDETVDRTSDHTGWIKDYTLEELSRFNFCFRFKEMGFQKIPTLREYMEWVKDTPLITNIELKTSIVDYPGIEKSVYDLICEYHLQKKVILSSFNHFSVLRMKELDPELVCGFLTECCMIHPEVYTAHYKVEAYHPRFTTLSAQTVRELHSLGLQVNPWTVNEQEDIDRMMEYGVDGIISNYPDIVAKKLSVHKGS